MPISLAERTSYIPRADYERAYALIEGEERAKTIVDDMFALLLQNPDDHIVLDPKFVALLSLVSGSGKALAATLLGDDQLRDLQSQLVREYSAVADAFPELRET